MTDSPIYVDRSLMRHRGGFVGSHLATTVEGVRFTNSSTHELALVIARKFGWTVKSTKERFVIREAE